MWPDAKWRETGYVGLVSSSLSCTVAYRQRSMYPEITDMEAKFLNFFERLARSWSRAAGFPNFANGEV